MANQERICDEMSLRIIDAAEHLARAEGAHKVTVRKVLRELQITNRVFYNRSARCWTSSMRTPP